MPPQQGMLGSEINRLTQVMTRMTGILERNLRGGGFGGLASGALAGGLVGTMTGASRAITDMDTNINKQTRNLENQARSAQKLTLAYGLLSGAVLGWVRAGLSGTTAGERMAFNFQMISREIAQLFLPAIEKVLHFMEDVIRRFRELSGEQQNAIGRWIGIGTAVLAVMVILPKLIAGFQSLQMVLTALGVGNPFGMVLTVVGLILTSSKEAREAFGELFKSLSRLAGALGTALAPVLRAITEQFEKWGPALASVMRLLADVINGMSDIVGLASQIPGMGGRGGRGGGGGGTGDPRGSVLWRLLEGSRLSGGMATTQVGMLTGAGINALQWGLRRMGLGPAAGGGGTAQDEANRNQLVNARSGFEDVQATFRRIQEAALRTDYAKQTAENTRSLLEVTREQNGYLSDIARNILGPLSQQPVVGR